VCSDSFVQICFFIYCFFNRLFIFARYLFMFGNVRNKKLYVCKNIYIQICFFVLLIPYLFVQICLLIFFGSHLFLHIRLFLLLAHICLFRFQVIIMRCVSPIGPEFSHQPAGMQLRQSVSRSLQKVHYISNVFFELAVLSFRFVRSDLLFHICLFRFVWSDAFLHVCLFMLVCSDLFLEIRFLRFVSSDLLVGFFCCSDLFLFSVVFSASFLCICFFRFVCSDSFVQSCLFVFISSYSCCQMCFL
jgi:hypothetical protein